jgi:uncharacterized membrane protein YdjX (TVP38/TMEM64 family)
MSQHTEPKKRLARNLLLLLIPALLAGLVVLCLWLAHPDIGYWKQLLLDGRGYLEAHPWTLVLALAILPGLGFPISPLLILVGVVLGPLYGIIPATLIGVTAQTCCLLWTYWLAAGPLRGFLKKTVLKKWTLPELTQRGALRIGFIIRVTPGIPYSLQNVALGVMGLRFKTYLIASVPVQALYSTGFIVTGGAIFQGKGALALIGVALLVVVIVATRMLLNRSRKNVR